MAALNTRDDSSESDKIPNCHIAHIELQNDREQSNDGESRDDYRDNAWVQCAMNSEQYSGNE